MDGEYPETWLTCTVEHLILDLAPQVSDSLTQHTYFLPSAHKHAVIAVQHVFVFLSQQTTSQLQIKCTATKLRVEVCCTDFPRKSIPQ